MNAIKTAGLALSALALSSSVLAYDFDFAVWRGETAHLWMEDRWELGTPPPGVHIRLGRVKLISFRPETNRMIYQQVADRVVWGDDSGAGPLVAEISADVDAKPGKYVCGNMRLTVVDRVLPPPSKWRYVLDLWQHPWAIARYFKVKPFSPEFYRRAQPVLATLATAGQKFLTTTLLDEPWNHQCRDAYHSMIGRTKMADGSWRFDYSVFDAYVDFGRACGIGPNIACYTMCPWGNRVRWQNEKGETEEASAPAGSEAFKDFWGDFLVDFAKHLKAKGWFDDTYIAMDERSPEEVRAIVEFVQQKAPGLKISMAGNRRPSEFEGLKIDCYSQIVNLADEKFLAELPDREKSGAKTTIYVCCGPAAPNTFLVSFPFEAFWLGYYPATKKGMNGFLRWAWNSWGENPYQDASFCEWRAGDVFLAYPDGSPSWRFLMLRAGIVAAEKTWILRDAGILTAELDAVAKEYDYKTASEKLGTIRPLNDRVLKLVNSPVK